MDQLMHFNKARQELELAKNIDEVKDIRDKAEALRAYAKQAGYSLEMQNQCAEIKIRAERKAGEMLAETELNKGGRPAEKTSNTMLQVNDQTLSDLGIERIQSHRWQKIASIPEDKFEERIDEIVKAKEELTTVGFIKIKLEDIKDTDPQREHGNIKDLAESIKKEGLLHPLVINQDNELICGRRRFAAVKMLEWTVVPVNQIQTKDDIDKLLKTLAENIMRKDLTWQEEVKQKAEVDQLMREKYGSAKPGGDRQTESGKKHRSESDQWSTQKTAEILNQSKTVIVEDLQLAKDLDEDPELTKIKRKSFAKRTVKQKKKRYEIDQIPKEELKGKYNILLADPPWDYDTKATALRGRALGNSSKADNNVLGLFAGSGSIMISSERMRRNCYCMELDPKFCDVIMKL